MHFSVKLFCKLLLPTNSNLIVLISFKNVNVYKMPIKYRDFHNYSTRTVNTQWIFDEDKLRRIDLPPCARAFCD